MTAEQNTWLAVVELAINDFASGSGETYSYEVFPGMTKKERSHAWRREKMVKASDSARMFLFSSGGSWAEWRTEVCDMLGVSADFLQRVAREARAHHEKNRILDENIAVQVEVP